MRTRKVLQELQVSATDKRVLVGSPSKMAKETSDKVSTRRNKRKNAGEQSEMIKSSKEETTKKANSKNSKVRTEKENVPGPSKIEETVLLNQSKIENFLTPCPNKKVEKKFSEEDNFTLSKSILEGIALITTDSPSQSYWQELAEQRRIALEKTLLENELLTDQVSVLQTENLQLKSALTAAEKLLRMEGLLD